VLNEWNRNTNFPGSKCVSQRGIALAAYYSFFAVLMMKCFAFREFWRRIVRTKYARELEAEVAQQRAEIDGQRAEIDRQRAELERLRAENRALLDSILGIAGIPPLTFPAQSHSESARADDESALRLARCGGPPPPANHAGTNGLSALRQEPERSDSLGQSADNRPRNDSPHSSPRVRPIAPPHRRRSWHQINRILEIESARKLATADS